MIDIIFNAAASELVKIILILSISVFLIYKLGPRAKQFYRAYIAVLIAPYLKLLRVPQQFVPVVNFLSKYKVDILLAMLLLLLSLVYTRKMAFDDQGKETEKVELVVETMKDN